MSANFEAKNFEYLAAKTCGEIWSFNFRSMLIDSYGQNIPISTYSNWSQRQSIPPYIPSVLVSTLKKRSDEVTNAYLLHTYGLDEKSGTKTVKGVTYDANLDELIQKFLTENISEIGDGTVIYFDNHQVARTYTFVYKDEIRKHKKVNGVRVEVKELRGEPIKAVFHVNHFALSLKPFEGEKQYKIPESGDFLVKLLTLKDDLKKHILKSIQINQPYHK